MEKRILTDATRCFILSSSCISSPKMSCSRHLASLPALHLTDGSLLPSTAISKYIAKEKAAQVPSVNDSMDVQVDGDKLTIEENANLQNRTFTSLVDSKLQPALVSSLHNT